MNNNVKLNKTDQTIMKIMHYFITKEDYKPIIINGINNEIWLENFNKPYKLIRININYIHNSYQEEIDFKKANKIMEKIRKKTYSLKINMLNLLLDTTENVKGISNDEINTLKIENITDIKKDKKIVSFYPNILNAINYRKSSSEEFFQLGEEMNRKSVEEEKKVEKILKNDKPIITYGIIGINILLFLAMYLFGNGSTDSITLLKFGANYAPLVEIGEIYRLFTSAFLHIGIIHLFFNMYVLFYVGTLVEKYYGKLKFILIYLGSALVGSLFSCLFSEAISAGASGAIFGLFGSLLYFGYHYRASLDHFLKSQLIPLLVLNLILGFVIPGIDISAHIGGLLGGVMFSVVVGIKNKTSKSEQINGIIICFILIAFLSYLLFFR